MLFFSLKLPIKIMKMPSFCFLGKCFFWGEGEGGSVKTVKFKRMIKNNELYFSWWFMKGMEITALFIWLNVYIR